MINFCAPKNDRKIYIMCAIISSLTEFKDSSRADIQPSSVSKLTPSPNLRRIPRKRVPPSGGRTCNIRLQPFVCASNFVSVRVLMCGMSRAPSPTINLISPINPNLTTKKSATGADFNVNSSFQLCPLIRILESSAMRA